MTESFSTRLNDAMALRELKQIDFVHAAEKFNIKLGKSHMSQYVSGKTVPRADIAHFLAAYLRVNEDWLMGKEWARCAEDVAWRRTKLGLRLSAEEMAALDAYMAQRP